VKNSKLSFDVGDDHVEFNLFKTSEFSLIPNECNRVDVIDRLVKEEDTNQVSSAPLGHCVLNGYSTKDEDPKVAICALFLEASPQVQPTLAKGEDLGNDDKLYVDEE